ncbi:MAG: hypothetical protein IJ054_00980, partial [Lachnospiraceae bacterium]|nr:hypothetical protein [Lachnospiraceae bacterium]
MKEKLKTKLNLLKEKIMNAIDGLFTPADLTVMDDGMGTVEVILIIVGICIADKSRILCGNFRCI